jgi:hypothetical protein
VIALILLLAWVAVSIPLSILMGSCARFGGAAAEEPTS